MPEFKRDQYQILFEHSADAMLIIDQEKFIECNDAALQMLGYSNREELLSTHPSQLSPEFQPDGRPSFEKANEMIAMALEKGSNRFIWIHTRANGNAFPVEVLLTAVPYKGRKLIHVVWRDISERMQLEAELENHRDHLQQLVDEQTRDLIEARDAAERASKVKSQFLGAMSHELRTPLNAIIGFTDAIKSEVFGPLDHPEYEKYIDLINSSGSHLLQLINDILDVSAIEAGELKIDEEAINLHAVTDACLSLVEQRAHKAGIVCIKDIPDDLGAVLIDERRCKQIILNLLTNAIKFTDAGGKILVIGRQNEEGGLTLAVEDNGIGMDKRGIKTALTQFGQVEDSLTRNTEGTGLGLPL